MPSQAITLQLPLPVYQIFQSRAEQAHRSVEVELQETVASAAEEEILPSDVSLAMQGLNFLDDEGLWCAARSALTGEQYRELAALNYKQQSEGLLSADRQRQEQLLALCDRVMVIRAHAARLLKERGHDVSPLLHAA